MYHNQELTIRLNQGIIICNSIRYVRKNAEEMLRGGQQKALKKKKRNKTEKEGKRAVRKTRGRKKVEKEERTGEERSQTPRDAG